MAEPTNDKNIGQRLGSALRERDWAGVLIELAIVMVGVFLGIEATNWNQARQDRAQEKRYYAQIVVDLRRDVETLQDSQRLSRDHDAAAETLIHAMDDGIPARMTASDFASSVQLAGFLYIPSPTRRTYDELISTGNLRLLRDGEAKDAIAAYYEAFAELRQWDVLLRQQQADYWSASAGIVPRRVLQAPFADADLRVSPAEAQEILKRARMTPRLRDLLVGMAAHQARVRRDSIQLEAQARALINKLQPLSS